MTPTTWQWTWTTRLPERVGQPFRVTARGALNSCRIQFLTDNAIFITSRNALGRKAACARPLKTAEPPMQDDPMTPEEYRAAIARHGLTQGQAGRLWGVAPRTGQRYATGEAPIPQLVARVLRLAAKNPQLLVWLATLAGD